MIYINMDIKLLMLVMLILNMNGLEGKLKAKFQLKINMLMKLEELEELLILKM